VRQVVAPLREEQWLEAQWLEEQRLEEQRRAAPRVEDYRGAVACCQAGRSG
jgi:hypothetical protein